MFIIKLINFKNIKLIDFKHIYYLIDAVSQVSWARRSEASTRSHISDRASLISSIPGGPDGDVRLTPQQYGVLGKPIKLHFLRAIIFNHNFEKIK